MLLVHGLVFQCTALSAIKITSERLVAMTVASKGDSCNVGEPRNTQCESEKKNTHTTCTLTERQHRRSSHSPFCCFNRFPFGCSFVFFNIAYENTHYAYVCITHTHEHISYIYKDIDLNYGRILHRTQLNW